MFWAPCSSGEGTGGSGGCLGAFRGMRVSPHACACMHMHAHACTCTHMHAHTCIKLQMATDMEASMFSMFIMFNMHVHACMCACTCMCVCVCMGHPTPPYQPPPLSTHLHPRGWIPRISKNSITLELIKIFQFRLKI